MYVPNITPPPAWYLNSFFVMSALARFYAIAMSSSLMMCHEWYIYIYISESVCSALRPGLGLLSFFPDMCKVGRCQPQGWKKKGTAEVPLLITVDVTLINHPNFKYLIPAGYKLRVGLKG